MKLSILTRTLTLLSLSTSLVLAEVQRKEVSLQGDWSVATLTDNGKPHGAEMLRTYDGKQDVHLRLRSNDSGVFLDATQDWSALSEAKTQPVQLRINSSKGKVLWKGTGNVVEDADGLGWLRAELTDRDSGQVNEALLEAMMEGGKTLHWSIGTGANAAQWIFHLDGAKAAYETMHDALQNPPEPAAAPAKAKGKGKASEPEPLVEHDYAQPGDWAVHYYTDAKGKFVRASMIRYFDKEKTLRVTLDDKNTYLDTQGDWVKLDAATGGNNANISLKLSTAPGDEGIDEKASVIDDEGDKWLRITQSHDDPGGMTDGVRNGNMCIFKAKGKTLWTFDLKGSHAASEKLYECFDKYRN